MATRQNPNGQERTAPARRLLTVREVADTLAISVRSVWRLISLDELPTVQVGRARRIPAAAVEAFIEKGGAR